MATRIEFHKHGGRKCFRPWSLRQRNRRNTKSGLRTKPLVSTSSTPISVADSIRPVVACGPGTEAAGVVSKVGNGVEHIRVGDRVVYAQSTLGAYSSVHNVPADKAAILPDAISNRRQPLSQGVDRFYLLRKTYEVKPDEPFLFHAAAGGVGLIACQWAKALGAKLIGTVGSAQKRSGRWTLAPQVINYRGRVLSNG